MRPFELLALAGLFLAACTVDGSVIDDLPCECADGFVCDVTTNRCVAAGASARDAGIDTFDSATADGVTPDAGPVRDPDLGDCLVGAADTFAFIDSDRWASTTDSVGEQSIDDGVFVTRVPADNRAAYSFLSERERVDLRDCAILIEMPAAQSGDDGVSFFSARISNSEGNVGFGVLRDEIVADYYDGSETTTVWSADYDPDEHRWFAFRGDDGEMIWLLSADGRDWTEVGRVAAPIALDTLQPLFGVGANRDNLSYIEARFDNYNNPP